MDGLNTLAAGAVTPVTRDTLQEQVHRQLCDLILDGSFAPGETITIHSLAEAFGVSPMPVREALKRLTAANALTVVSGRSVGVPPLSRARLTDLRNVRVEIEALAASWSVARAVDADVEMARGQLERLQAAIAEGDLKTYLRSNHAFHFTIYRASGSDILLRIIEDLWLQISPYFHKLHGSYSAANDHHREMMGALVDRSDLGMRQAVRADIDAAYRTLAPQLA